MRLLENVYDPVTLNVLYNRGQVLHGRDLNRLIREYSIDEVDAVYVTSHSER